MPDTERSIDNLIPLNDHHDRESFRCVSDAMNDFLRLDSRRSEYATFVVPEEPGSARVIAYFTVAREPETIEWTAYFRRGDRVLRLEALAVHAAYEDRDIGKDLMEIILRNALDKAQEDSRIKALVFFPLNERAEGFYEALGIKYTKLPHGDWAITIEEVRRALAR